MLGLALAALDRDMIHLAQQSSKMIFVTLRLFFSHAASRSSPTLYSEKRALAAAGAVSSDYPPPFSCRSSPAQRVESQRPMMREQDDLRLSSFVQGGSCGHSDLGCNREHQASSPISSARLPPHRRQQLFCSELHFAAAAAAAAAFLLGIVPIATSASFGAFAGINAARSVYEGRR